MKEPLPALMLRWLLYIVFIAGVVALVTLPWMIEIYMEVLYDAFYMQEAYKTFVVVFLECAGALALWVVVELLLILRTVREDPFVSRNVSALRRVGIAAVLLSVMFFLKCVYYVTFLTLVCGIVFVVCALVIFTVAALFAQAVSYKQDIDLTI